MSNQITVFLPWSVGKLDALGSRCGWHLFWGFNRIIAEKMGTYTSSPLFISIKEEKYKTITFSLDTPTTMTTLLKIRNRIIENSPLCTSSYLVMVARDSCMWCYFSQQLTFEPILCLKVCRGIVSMSTIIDVVLFFNLFFFFFLPGPL